MEKKLWMDYKLYLTVLVVTIASEKIGIIKIPLGPGAVTLLPLIYAMIIALVLYLIKPLQFLKEEQSDTASSMISIGITLMIAKMSITNGVAIEDIITAGPALISERYGSDTPEFRGVMIVYVVGDRIWNYFHGCYSQLPGQRNSDFCRSLCPWLPDAAAQA